jgi:hypothetical protein
VNRDERRLLRAALLNDSRAVDAWRDFRAEHGGIDHLTGDGFALLPLLFCNLREVAPEDPALGVLGGIYRRTWYANQMLLYAAAQAVSGLEAAGVRAMLVGNGALVALHPRNVGARRIDAIDLRVAPRHRRRALACLRHLGWVRRSPSSAAERLHSWHRVRLSRGTREQLNLHLSTAATEADRTTVRGVSMLVPSSTEQLLLTCPPRRGRSAPGPLRWIPDAALIIRSAAPLDEERLRSCARALAYLAAEFGLEPAPNGSRVPPPVVTPADARGARLDVGRVQDFRRLALDSALGDVIRALAARGARPLLIKGPAFASWLYDDPRERPYGDIDLLVAPERFAAAENVLSELGFESWASRTRPSERSAHHEEWIRPGTLPVAVELHHTLRLLPASPPLVWQRLTEGARTIQVGGTAVAVPSEPASALIVALHAAQHADRQSKSARDLRHALERVDMETWRAAASLADQLGASTAFAAGLRLAPEGRNVCRRLDLGEGTSRDVELRATASPTAIGIEQLMTTRGAGARLRLISQKLIPSLAIMRASSPLTRQGRLGLARAYLRRPFQMAGNLPRGIRAWRQAASGQPQHVRDGVLPAVGSPSGQPLPGSVDLRRDRQASE